VTACSVPLLVATVTGLSGRTAEAPLAGTIETLAAAGSCDWVPPGVVDAPGVELVVPDPEVPESAADVSLHAVPATSNAQIPATARPCFRKLLNT
jgi:hypothetical protein